MSLWRVAEAQTDVALLLSAFCKLLRARRESRLTRTCSGIPILPGGCDLKCLRGFRDVFD
jgi:hypothetical protein